jgi:hypothetical protein
LPEHASPLSAASRLAHRLILRIAAYFAAAGVLETLENRARVVRNPAGAATVAHKHYSVCKHL